MRGERACARGRRGRARGGAGGRRADGRGARVRHRRRLPQREQGTLRAVERGGALVSEYYLGEAPLAWRFPARNRIIAGLSDVVVVVEAPEKSGALITARHALEAGRDVWAVPGPPGALECRGSNRLLADGAGVLWDVDEFVDAVGPRSAGVQAAACSGRGCGAAGSGSGCRRARRLCSRAWASRPRGWTRSRGACGIGMRERPLCARACWSSRVTSRGTRVGAYYEESRARDAAHHRRAVVALSGGLGPRWTRGAMDYDERRAAEREARGFRDRLVVNYSPLVKYVAGRVSARVTGPVEQEDVVSWGLFRAARRHRDLRSWAPDQVRVLRDLQDPVVHPRRVEEDRPAPPARRGCGCSEAEPARNELAQRLGRAPTEAEVARRTRHGLRGALGASGTVRPGAGRVSRGQARVRARARPRAARSGGRPFGDRPGSRPARPRRFARGSFGP